MKTVFRKFFITPVMFFLFYFSTPIWFSLEDSIFPPAADPCLPVRQALLAADETRIVPSWDAFAQPTDSGGNLDAAIEEFGKLNAGQKNLILSATGMPQAGDFNAANMAAYLIFGAIGFIVFFYGRKQSSWKPIVIGILLMAYPYFVSGTLLLYLIGIGLTASLYFFRE